MVPPSTVVLSFVENEGNGVHTYKWDCAQAMQSSSVSGVELATSKVY